MRRFLVAAAFCTLVGAFTTTGTAQEKDEAKKKAQAALAQMLNSTTEEFIKRFDKNGDGVLTKEELPPRLAAAFERFDADKNGSLDKQEVGEMLKTLRARFGNDNKTPATKTPETKPATKTPETKPSPEKTNPQVEAIVDDILARMDTNKDGQISKDEAKNFIAANFASLDTNGDGFLDRNELRQFAQRRLAQGGPGGPGFPGGNRPGLDFDALDKNADGRLTREEVKGTPLADKFDEIDTNKDGKIDVKEFRAYLKKQQEEKK
jgi:Ca2+-binding EF-hand superfamily protein